LQLQQKHGINPPLGGWPQSGQGAIMLFIKHLHSIKVRLSGTERNFRDINFCTNLPGVSEEGKIVF
jgi:hypothetical protein